jgi:Na+-driven multidrug efflux pump
MLILILTPLSGFWFGTISGLPPNLVSLAESAFWVVALWPALNVLQSFYQGVIMHSGQTRAITESVIAFLGVAGLVLLLGVLWVPWPGLYVGLAASVMGSFAQAFWLRRRSRRWVQQVFARDGARRILI